jgi:hypothetical protein
MHMHVPRGGLNKGTKARTINVATQGCDNIKYVMDKTAPRIWVLRFGHLDPGT